MFPKKYRLNSRLGDDFFINSERIYSPLFVLYYQKRDDQQVKAAVIVPKKNASKATQRSEIKRKMRISLTPLLDKLSSLNIVLYLKVKVTDKNETDFEKEINYLVYKVQKRAR